MQALEIDTTIDSHGDIHLPEEYRNLYGKRARLIILLPERDDTPQTIQIIDPMVFSGQVAWPMDGLAYQKSIRNEWD